MAPIVLRGRKVGTATPRKQPLILMTILDERERVHTLGPVRRVTAVQPNRPGKP
jgi:hypothetical protein